MFQFPRCPPRTLCIQVRVIRVHLIGFPHSDMSGSTLATSSPDLFAGGRVLPRPLGAGHPALDRAAGGATTDVSSCSCSFAARKHDGVASTLLRWRSTS